MVKNNDLLDQKNYVKIVQNIIFLNTLLVIIQSVKQKPSRHLNQKRINIENGIPKKAVLEE